MYYLLYAKNNILKMITFVWNCSFALFNSKFLNLNKAKFTTYKNISTLELKPYTNPVFYKNIRYIE